MMKAIYKYQLLYFTLTTPTSHYVEFGQFKRLLKTFLFGEAAAH